MSLNVDFMGLPRLPHKGCHCLHCVAILGDWLRRRETVTMTPAPGPLCAVCGKPAHPWACEGGPDPWRDGFRNGIERGIVIAAHLVPAPDGPRPRFADEIVHALGRELGWA